MATLDPQPQGLTIQDLTPERSPNKPSIESRSSSVIYEAPASPDKNYENFGTFGVIKSIDEQHDADKFINAKSPIANKPPSHTDVTETKQEESAANLQGGPLNAQHVNARILGLLQNCDNVLKKSQGLSLKDKTPIVPAYEQPAPVYNQTHYRDQYSSLTMNFSDSVSKPEVTGTSLKYSASLIPHSAVVTGNIESEISEIQKNGDYTKRSYDYSYADSESSMRNEGQPVFHNKEVYQERVVKASNELFPIKESERSSMISTGPTDIREVTTLKSRINSLEEKLNSLDGYKSTTLADTILNSRQPRTYNGYDERSRSPYGGVTPNFSATAPNNRIGEFSSSEPEIPKRSQLYSSQQENYKPFAVSTGPEDVSQQAVQNIDRLIQNQLLNRHMKQSKVSQQPKSQYTSPTKMPFEVNPLYKSNVFLRSEEPPSSYKTYGEYDIYRETNTSQPVEREVRSWNPLYTSSHQDTFNKTDLSSESRSTQRYIRPLERSMMTSPRLIENTLEPKYSNAFDESSPIVLAKPYDIASTFDTRPFESHKMGQNYNTGPYINKLEDYSHYEQGFSDSRTPVFTPYQAEFNAGKAGAPLPPISNDVTSPTAELSSDRKMKKLTLKSRPSEEKDPRGEKDLSSAKKNLHTAEFNFTSENEPSMFDFNAETLHSDHDSPQKGCKSGNADHDESFNPGQPRKVKFNASDLIPDQDDVFKQEFRAGEILSDDISPLKGILKSESTLKKNYSQAQNEEITDDFHASDLLPDSDSPRNRNVKVGSKAAPEKVEKSKKVNFNSGDLIPDAEAPDFRASDLINDAETPLNKITANIPDDGRAWFMVHRLQSEVFESADNSFHFDAEAFKSETIQEQKEKVKRSQPPPADIAKHLPNQNNVPEEVIYGMAQHLPNKMNYPDEMAQHLPDQRNLPGDFAKHLPNQMNNSVLPSQYIEDRENSKANIWLLDSSDNLKHHDLLRSSTRLSESMKKAPKARLIAHCFEKYGDFNLKP